MHSLFWLFVVGSVACGGHPSEPRRPDGSNAPVPADAGVPVATPGPGERECTELFAHAIDLQLAEIERTKPAHMPTADELARLRADLRDQFLDSCRATTADRYRCAMAATTLTGLGACQATPSSSTSNSSVAPGGMTPAAPRSP